MRRALLVAINNYPNPADRLAMPIYDLERWAKLLQRMGFSILTLRDSNATYEAVTRELELMVMTANAGDHLVFFYSGHGSYQLDVDGDEEDGYDEVICLYNRDLPDDDMRRILDKLPDRVAMTLTLDSCFGGTMTRSIVPAGLTRKFRPPLVPIPKHVKRKKRFIQVSAMREVLMTGCGDNEYSYEDENGGVFSTHALTILTKVLDEGHSDILEVFNYNDFEYEIHRELPTRNFPQTPQVEGSQENKSKVMYKEPEVISDEPPAPPQPEPQPEPDQNPAPPEGEPASEGWDWCGFRRVKKYYLKFKRKMRAKRNALLGR